MHYFFTLMIVISISLSAEDEGMTFSNEFISNTQISEEIPSNNEKKFSLGKEVGALGAGAVGASVATPIAISTAGALGVTAGTGTAISALSGAAAISATSAAVGAGSSVALATVGIFVAPAVIGGTIIAGIGSIIAGSVYWLVVDD